MGLNKIIKLCVWIFVWLWIILTGFLLARECRAEVIKIRAVAVERSWVSERYMWEIQKHINEFVEPLLRITYAIHKVESVPDTAPAHVYTLDGFWMHEGFFYWKGTTNILKGLEPPLTKWQRGLTVVYAPAIVDGGLRYGAGKAFGGPKGGTIVMHAKAEYFWKMYVTTLHEFLHTLGAYDECPEGEINIMCANVVYAPQWSRLELSERNKRVIRRKLIQMKAARRRGN